jgi:hypothetical protein
MKGNIKKLAVFLMIAVMAIFVTAATASAGDRDRDDHQKGIIGEWGFSGGGNCVVTPAANWNPTSENPFALVDPAKVSFSSFHAQGIVTFGHNGKGTIDFVTVGTPTAPLFTGAPAWSTSSYHITYPFTYTLTHDGELTFEADLNTMKTEDLNVITGTPTGGVVYRDHYSLTGWVSADHKTMTLATPSPKIVTNMLKNTVSGNTVFVPIQKMICHDSQVATRLSN